MDILYVKTPKEWKGILLPLHPIYLWRYYEVFRTLPGKKAILSDDDKDALASVLSRLPQVLSFIIANSVVPESEDRVLPCSGSIEMLPTFENKTKEHLECLDVILEVADDLCRDCQMEEYGLYRDPEWESKYIYMKAYRPE